MKTMTLQHTLLKCFPPEMLHWNKFYLKTSLFFIKYNSDVQINAMARPFLPTVECLNIFLKNISQQNNQQNDIFWQILKETII